MPAPSAYRDPETENQDVLAGLSEYDCVLVRLDEEDACFLRERLRFGVSGPWDGDWYQIEVRSHVCRALLPSSKQMVRVRPKLSIRNVLEMLGVAYKLYTNKHADPFAGLAEVGYEAASEIFETLVRHFMDHIEVRLRNGLISDYIWQEENLTTVRGQISFASHVRDNLFLRHRIFCKFSEFVQDIPENQVLLWTLVFLSRMDFWTEETRRRILGAIMQFNGVSLRMFRKGEFPMFHYHRLNDDYKHLHAWARLFLDMAAFSDNVGDVEFRGFVLDMNYLFEQFVTQAFLENSSEFEALPQEKLPLFEDSTEPMRPDLMILLNGKPIAVVDAKYKRIQEEEFKSFDVYQVIAYSTVLKVDTAFLIYPEQDESKSGWRGKVRQSPIQVSVQTVDLSPQSISLREQARCLAENLLQQLRRQVS